MKNFAKMKISVSNWTENAVKKLKDAGLQCWFLLPQLRGSVV